MKIYQFDQRAEEWQDFRKGKVTGTKLKDILVKRGTSRKLGFYELIAERICEQTTDENPMERGVRLEDEARQRFEKETGKTVEVVGICTREDNQNIAVSPDGIIKNNGKYTESIEIKCLSSSRHLQAKIENEIPDEHFPQVIQNFIVNDDLKTLYFVFYDPRCVSIPFFYLIATREELQGKIAEYKEYQETVLKEVDEICINLAF